MHISLGDFPSSNPPGVSSNDLLSFFLGDVDETINPDSLSLNTNFTDTTGYHFVTVTVSGLDTSPSAEMFLNGVSVDTDVGTMARTGRSTWDTQMRLGRPGASTRYYDGRLDEVRIATVVRSDDWIQTEYHNQSNPATFYTVGNEETAPVTDVTLQSLTATSYQDGVLLRWQTGLDVNNLGWHVYRVVNGKRVQLTTELIAGSALMFGPGIHLNAGNSYMWWDPSGRVTDRYWVADQDLRGPLTIHGPVEPSVTTQPSPMQRRSALLSQVGQKQTVRTKTRGVLATKPIWRQNPTSVRQVVMSSHTLQPWERPNLPPLSIQYALAAAPAIKLTTWERGWYRASQPALVAAGLSPNVDPRRLQLFMGGKQQSILVQGGEDGHFGPQDAIEFYGVELDTPWTATRTYWLVAGSQPGKRVRMEPYQVPGSAPPQSFPFTAEREDRALYLAMVKNGEAENFFGAVIANEPVQQRLALLHLDPGATANAQLEVALQGVTSGAHQVVIQLNGYDVGTMTFPGQIREVATFPIPQAWLQNGDNSITLTPIDGEGVSA